VPTNPAIPRVPPRMLALATRGMASRAFTHWAFGHYLRIAPPEFAHHSATAPARVEAALAA
jgi:hypothetical protein